MEAKLYRKMQQRQSTMIVSVHGHIGTADVVAKILKICECSARKEGEARAIPSICRVFKGVPIDQFVSFK